MYGLVVTLVFTGAAAVSLGTIAAMVLPQWRRIARLASGQVEVGFPPLGACES